MLCSVVRAFAVARGLPVQAYRKVYSMKVFAVAALVVMTVSLNITVRRDKTKQLFNGRNLKGWDTYIGPAYDSVQKKFAGIPVGLNEDPFGLFSIVQADGQPAIRISGEHFGGISTVEDFENYHLRLEFKWGTKKWNPKKNGPRDSGVLYHAGGAHGADGNFWMRSHEFQIQEGDCGDYWGVAGGTADIPARKEGDDQYVYDPTAPLVTFRDGTAIGRHCVKNSNGEKSSGEWNTIELYCVGDTSVHVVNRKVNMVLYHLARTSGAGMEPMAKGKIQIQSEGAEVFYRNISIEPVKRIPKDLLHVD